MSGVPIRTLIVDDDPAARQLHARFVSGIDGFVLVGAVGTGETAVAVASRSDVDLVLLDINLPDFSGVEVLRRLREARGGAVDIYVLSSARDRNTVRQSISARIVGFLAKPFTREALAQRLIAYRDARRASDPASAERTIPLGQQEIDELIAVTAPIRRPVDDTSASAILPKGIATHTLDLVRATLGQQQAMTVLEVAAAVGVSRATARRYLDHLVHAGALDVSHRFGRRGRPETLYRLAPPAG